MHDFWQSYPSSIEISEMPTVLEAGTLNGHGIAGLHAALNYILNVGTEQIKRIECQSTLNSLLASILCISKTTLLILN